LYRSSRWGCFPKNFLSEDLRAEEEFRYYQMKAPFEAKTALAYVEGQRAMSLAATPRQRQDVEDFLRRFPAGKQ
jgi:hypothetical protein